MGEHINEEPAIVENEAAEQTESSAEVLSTESTLYQDIMDVIDAADGKILTVSVIGILEMVKGALLKDLYQ